MEFRDFVDLELGANEVARFDTSDANPGFEYHDEHLAYLVCPELPDRDVFYRRGNELPRYWPDHLGFPTASAASAAPPTTGTNTKTNTATSCSCGTCRRRRTTTGPA